MMKKLLLTGTAVLLMATSASAQSSMPRGIIDGDRVCVYMYNGPGLFCQTMSPQIRAERARAKADHECKAYGNCGQRRR
jgi:hypothetical protein